MLSRNIFFYKKVKLPDNFETRIYLMFIHFSIMMIIFREKGEKFSQKSYDFVFHNIENNLRELGFGDVSVNKKMKDFNKILYDILLKIEEIGKNSVFTINRLLIIKYFKELDNENSLKYDFFSGYFEKYFAFCFELPLENMLKNVLKFRY